MKSKFLSQRVLGLAETKGQKLESYKVKLTDESTEKEILKREVSYLRKSLKKLEARAIVVAKCARTKFRDIKNKD
ncbi:hypothetical protein [Spiroplasma alleghenense]|uniref:Uncharacterized protein n=1 Tax=Spiroplasma alleghenense TaxID=216931 RepID=A0A345Z2Y1_9MOLU|nr:hypothetical protein [Spiroplasma alleghenense]AXK50960.1 hypothetical protein SALLE_v1c02860 [Spiroplasma alleghenense]